MPRVIRYLIGAGALLGLLATTTPAGGDAMTLPASACSRATTMKTVFPRSAAVGFDRRSRIKRTRTRPQSPNECVSWSTTYTGYRGASDSQPLPKQAFAEVTVTLFKTRRDALAALEEPAFGPMRTLPSRARIRTLVSRPSVDGDASREAGAVASVIGNTFVISTGQGRPPAYRGNE